MKVEIKKVDATKRELSFEIPKERVAKKTEEVYRDIGKVAKVKGFRQGKVPRNIIESHYGTTAKEEIVKQLIPEVYQEGISSENILPIDMPEINDIAFEAGIIKFKAVLDVKPEVKIKDYKGISVKRKSSQASEEEINKSLEYFKKSQGHGDDVPIDDAFANGCGYPSLEEFKKSLSRLLEADKDKMNRLDVENQIAESLIKKGKLSVPQSLVQKKIERILQEEKERMQKQQMSEEEILKRQEALKKELPSSVEKEVKIYLILDKIAELENIAANKGENLSAKVIEFLLKEAKWT